MLTISELLDRQAQLERRDRRVARAACVLDRAVRGTLILALAGLLLAQIGCATTRSVTVPTDWMVGGDQ